ncbi:MAG: DUF6496 domain-containing protein [Asticcacaulis sp.]|uniref:DUF6496 domain-containing protein n=1 Tax=Asticcacaulis sp. TaxID=1872648 RepID=UPI0039E3BBE4
MPKPGESKDDVVERIMHEYKEGDLKSGSGGKVKSRKQAVAIALSESGQSKFKSKAENQRAFAHKDTKAAHAHTSRHH